MLDKFWESLGTGLAERWLEYIFGPALLFWAGGLGLYVWQTGGQQLWQAVQRLDLLHQISWIGLALVVLVFSSLLMQAIRFPVLRLLEGYWPWPFRYLALGILAVRKPSFQKKYEELRRLKAAEAQSNLNAAERERLSRLEVWAHQHPAKSDDLLPTTLGNILRARERSPQRKYGLDAVVCWPRLWPLLPDHVRTDLSNARSSLDRLVELWLWGLLFSIWAFWTPWAILISIVWMVVTYSMALQAALAYGDLLEAAFDLHRLSLYVAIGWPRPANSSEEKKYGAQLTEFLWRGTLPGQVTYQVEA